jgi:hypothetical protein
MTILSFTHACMQSHSEFHSDLFPDTVGSYSCLSAEDWAGGKNEPVSMPQWHCSCLPLSTGSPSQLRSCQEEGP